MQTDNAACKLRRDVGITAQRPDAVVFSRIFHKDFSQFVLQNVVKSSKTTGMYWLWPAWSASSIGRGSACFKESSIALSDIVNCFRIAEALENAALPDSVSL